MGQSVGEWPIQIDDEKLPEVIERMPIEDVLDFDEPEVGKQIIIDRFYDEGDCVLVEVTRSLLCRQPVVGELLKDVLILDES